MAEHLCQGRKAAFKLSVLQGGISNSGVGMQSACVGRSGTRIVARSGKTVLPTKIASREMKRIRQEEKGVEERSYREILLYSKGKSYIIMWAW